MEGKITVNEAAELVGVCKETIRRKFRAGEITGYREIPTRKLFFDQVEVLNAFQRRYVKETGGNAAKKRLESHFGKRGEK